MMPEYQFPILEFDPNPDAILNPSQIRNPKDAPAHVVICFFADILSDLKAQGKLELLANLKSEIGLHPLYIYQHGDRQLLVFHPGIGAPLAAGLLEEVIAMGAKYFIACGGCGVLDDHVDVLHPFIVTSAVRDEGTSYHYLPPAREVAAHPMAIEALTSSLNAKKLTYSLCKTWTTDAIYRETAGKRLLRIAEGCEVVEMEAAAFFAVAQFRKVVFGQLLYAGDLVKPEGWDGRSWNSRTDTRRLLFELAVESVIKLGN
jgi:uridine phosphorylase